MWAAASYAAVKAASVDTEAFSSAQGIRPKYPPLPMMIDFDAPEHVRRRRLVSEGFTPKRVRAMEDQLRVACDTILDTVCERGSCDFVADIAAPLPIAVIGDMLGVAPADRAELLEWSDVMLKAQGSPDPDAMVGAMHAFEGYTNYITPVLADRKATGSTRRPGRGAVPGRDRRRLARRGLAHPRDAAHPHRGRRDDASCHQRGHGGTAGPTRPAGPADRRSRRTHARCGRGDAALGVADQEHGPHGDARRGAGRRDHQGGSGAAAALPVGQPGRDGVRRPRHGSTSPAAPTRTSPSASVPTSASAINWPGWSSR